jgi:hypothetical protein
MPPLPRTALSCIQRKRPHNPNRRCALYAPEVECIGKRKARQPFGFGAKCVSASAACRPSARMNALSSIECRGVDVQQRWHSPTRRSGGQAPVGLRPIERSECLDEAATQAQGALAALPISALDQFDARAS